MVSSHIAKSWERLTVGIDRYEFVANFLSPMILLGVNFVYLFCGFLPCVLLGWFSIIGVDLYLFVLMLLAALKMPKRLPTRQVALVTVPALLLILVMSFAKLYIVNGQIGRMIDSKVETLEDPRDAAYFSLVTITTLGYGDYTPQKTGARMLVIGELLSGALLLFFAFPVLGSRLAMFDELTGKKTVVGIRRLDDGSWEVQENNASAISYPRGERLTISAVVQGKIEPSSSG
jgi:Ion channel